MEGGGGGGWHMAPPRAKVLTAEIETSERKRADKKEVGDGKGKLVSEAEQSEQRWLALGCVPNFLPALLVVP